MAGLVLAVTVLTLTGCTGDDAPAPPSATTPPPTTSASPSPTPREPSLPAAAKKPTRAGAEAFYRYFWDVYNYSFASLRTQTLRRVSTSTCDFCSSAASKIDENRSAGASYSGGAVSVNVAVSAPGNPRVGLLVNSVLSQGDGKTVDSSGAEGSIIEGRKNMRIDAAVAWNGKAWRMLKIDAGARKVGP